MKRQFKLDNASLAYTASRSRKWNATYRVGAVMTEAVDPPALKQAAKNLKNRFPTFYVQLRSGLAWDYLESVEDTDIVLPERGPACRPLPVGKGEKPMFRILYSGRRISVELFHCITDGTGAMIYLKSLLAEYLRLRDGVRIPCTQGVLNPRQAPQAGEFEDAYKRIATREHGLARREPNAYQYDAKVVDDNLYIINGLIPVDALKAVTRELGVTVNDYLVSAYIYAFYVNMDAKDRTHREIRINVPANLRPLFHSNTLRNFAMYYNIGLPARAKNYTFQEILTYISAHLRAGFQKESLRRSVCKNISDEMMPISQIAPSFLKKPFIKAGFHIFGEQKYTSPFSNLGVIKVPEEMEPYIERFDFVIGKTVKNKIYATAVSFRNTLNVTFSSISPCAQIQSTFFRFLQEQGIPVETSYSFDTENGSGREDRDDICVALHPGELVRAVRV